MRDSGFVLGLSTSSGAAHVAAVQAGSGGTQLLGATFKVLFEFSITEYRSQSAELLPRLEQGMVQAGLTGANCLAIAVDIGPGGFTSLRTACGVAQGLATAWQVPCVPLSSFECMAATFAARKDPDVSKGGEGVEAACLMDARLQEVYAAQLVLQVERTLWIKQPGLLPYSSAALHEFTREATNTLADAPIRADLLPQALAVGTSDVSLGFGTAALGHVRFSHGVVATPLDCQPLYVREKVAQTTQERRAARDVNL